jgi:hypothetical protein
MPQISGMRRRNGSPAAGVLRIRAEQCFPGDAETLLMHRMACAVAGAREPHAEAPGGAMEQYVIVGILAVGLDQEMIDIGDRRLGAYLLHAHGLKLESA